MKTQKVELTVDSDYCKVLSDPGMDGVRHVECLLSFTEINKLKRGNANIRPPEQKKRPFKAMLQTIEFSPRTFHIKNRGITYICSDVNYDERSGKLTVTIPDSSELKKKNGEVLRFGIADGGHTFEAIHGTMQDIKDFENIVQWTVPNARVHFLVIPDQNSIETVVEALNTSLQVQQVTLDEYQGKFETLKAALVEDNFDADLVAFRENEDKEWHVIEVIQRMACFLKDRWSSSQPSGMYKSKGKALRLFTNEATRKEFRQLYPVIREIITFPEYIQSVYSTKEIVSLKSLAKLKCVKNLKKQYTRPGTEYPTNHRFDMAALLPMAAAFRELLMLNENNNTYEWRFDPKDVFESCAEKLYKHLGDRVAQVPLSNMLSGDIDYWSGCLQIVMRAKNDLLEGKSRKSITKKAATRKEVTAEEPSQDAQEDENQTEMEASEETPDQE